MIQRTMTLAYSVEQHKKRLDEYTDEELTKKVRGCIVDCDECTWLHGCRYGQEFVRRGLRIERRRKTPKTDRRKRVV